MHGIVNKKTDVFSYRVLLLELVTGHWPVHTQKQNLVVWVSLYKKQAYAWCTFNVCLIVGTHHCVSKCSIGWWWYMSQSLSLSQLSASQTISVNRKCQGACREVTGVQVWCMLCIPVCSASSCPLCTSVSCLATFYEPGMVSVFLLPWKPQIELPQWSSPWKKCATLLVCFT